MLDRRRNRSYGISGDVVRAGARSVCHVQGGTGELSRSGGQRKAIQSGYPGSTCSPGCNVCRYIRDGLPFGESRDPAVDHRRFQDSVFNSLTVRAEPSLEQQLIIDYELRL